MKAESPTSGIPPPGLKGAFFCLPLKTTSRRQPKQTKQTFDSYIHRHSAMCKLNVKIPLCRVQRLCMLLSVQRAANHGLFLKSPQMAKSDRRSALLPLFHAPSLCSQGTSSQSRSHSVNFLAVRCRRKDAMHSWPCAESELQMQRMNPSRTYVAKKLFQVPLILFESLRKSGSGSNLLVCGIWCNEHPCEMSRPRKQRREID